MHLQVDRIVGKNQKRKLLRNLTREAVIAWLDPEVWTMTGLIIVGMTRKRFGATAARKGAGPSGLIFGALENS